MLVFKEREERGCLPNSGLRHKCDPNLRPSGGGKKALGSDDASQEEGICREPADPVLLQVAASMTPSSAGRDS